MGIVNSLYVILICGMIKSYRLHIETTSSSPMQLDEKVQYQYKKSGKTNCIIIGFYCYFFPQKLNVIPWTRTYYEKFYSSKYLSPSPPSLWFTPLTKLVGREWGKLQGRGLGEKYFDNKILYLSIIDTKKNDGTQVVNNMMEKYFLFQAFFHELYSLLITR